LGKNCAEASQMIRLTILPSQERDDNEVAEEENKAGSFIRMDCWRDVSGATAQDTICSVRC